MKKPRTSPLEKISVAGKEFSVPREKARALLVLLSDLESESKTLSSEEVFRDLHRKHTASGAILQGVRLKEGMTQVELAEKLQITQGDLSKMENGKRSIGKRMAQRLAKVLNVDYRVFL